MATSEAQIEKELISQLENLDYEKVKISNEKDLIDNLKTQLELHNKITLSDNEFFKITNYLNKGSVFDKAERLRDTYSFDGDDGNKKSINFFYTKDWCKNQFQVASQITMKGVRKNRYDVTLLINGLPLIQIELKHHKQLKEAFNQINRYKRHSFKSSLFEFIQIFVISNKNSTNYYANDKEQIFEKTIIWADEDNKKISLLKDFANDFLEPCNIVEMIDRYIVLTADKKIMILRPYQYYAVKRIIDKVKISNNNGYIWHTTGSGKTLTSFKASQVVSKMPSVDKVLFVVDRKDLDAQTKEEFNKFEKNCVDNDDKDSTKKLVKRLSGDNKVIVTTIQKLSRAISGDRYLEQMSAIKDKKIVLIFDECHRSQFGKTQLKINNFFTNNQMFGFTGTPIFGENAVKNKTGKHTTAEIFGGGEPLHKYIITDAISDGNVLDFCVEHWGKFTKITDNDEEVTAIDTEEALHSDKRLNKIIDYIIKNHNRVSKDRGCNAIFAVSSIPSLIKYYDMFKAKKIAKEHNLTIGTIFSFSANEEENNNRGELENDNTTIDTNNINVVNQDKLEEYIKDYNKEFGTSFTTKDNHSFYNYYDQLSKNVKTGKIDILLVVNMFLTGFDAKTVNVLYLDKHLKEHGLIQAYSRTNRIFTPRKEIGKIISFRDLRNATNEALEIFGNKDNKAVVLMQDYDYYLDKYNTAYKNFNNMTDSPSDVDNLFGEKTKVDFIKAFREVMRYTHRLTGFGSFDENDLKMDEELFKDYEDKYLNLYHQLRKDNQGNQSSILDDIDFQIELIQRDKINVDYILSLVAKIKKDKNSTNDDEFYKIMEIVGEDPGLSKKKDLIDEFINSNQPDWEDYLESKKIVEFDNFCDEFGLDSALLQEIINTYLYDEKTPLNDTIFNIIVDEKKPTLLNREKTINKIIDGIMNHIDRFYEL
jgi:type I restriction enzyme R subunit